MRRAIALLLTAVLLAALFGCSPSGETVSDDGAVFYYRAAEDSIASESGVLAPEVRQVDVTDYDMKAFLTLYLLGPQSEELVSPFPKNLRVIHVQNNQNAVVVVLDDSIASLSAVGLSVAASCLAQTLYVCYGTQSVTIQAQTVQLNGKDSIVIYPAELVLEDRGADQAETTVKLYFADEQNRYLLAEERTGTVEQESKLPEYIVQALINGPCQESLQATIPEGTMLLSVSVNDGICVVNLSSEFLYNRPPDEAGERMCLFSIVNSLTELESITSVEILIEGNNVRNYCYLDLTQPLVRDEAMIGPVRTGVGEFDATIYVCFRDDDRLSAYPVRLQEQAYRTRVDLVLEALIEFADRNGYYSPLETGTVIQSITVDGSVCTVDFGAELLSACDTDRDRALLLRSVVATLTSVDAIRIVVLSIDGTTASPRDYDDDLDKDWFHTALSTEGLAS